MQSKNYQALVGFLRQHGLRFHEDAGRSACVMGMTGENGSFPFAAIADDEKQRFVTYSMAPFHVPSDMRPAAAEYLTRANYGLVIGNFEMDYSDGEVRYKTAMDTDGIELNDRLIGLTVAVNCRMMDRYVPGLKAVIAGKESPQAAVERIEGPSRSRVEAVLSRLLGGFGARSSEAA